MVELKRGSFINTLIIKNYSVKYYGRETFTDITIEYIGTDNNGKYMLCNCPHAKIFYYKDIESIA